MEFLKNKGIAAIVLSVILICVLPMGINPYWRGSSNYGQNQYELMGDSLLHGRIDLDVEVSPELKAMDNPYDPVKREELGVDFRWDHAYYNEHYYMYFGVVPAVFVFAPFQLIFGTTLETYHATQLFVAIIILGIFALFWSIRKAYFKKMRILVYLFLATTASFMTVWYSIAAPALYCTAITAAIACEIWSFYFFFEALSRKKQNQKFLPCLLGGTILGALAFGCRPTIALANLILIPILWQIIKTEAKISIKIILKILASLVPYIVVGVLLMLYNYARFDSPFEFGQSYQLTVADQTEYSSSSINIVNLLNGFFEMFFRFDGFTTKPPFIHFAGVLWEFPIILLAIWCLFKRETWAKLKELRPFIITIAIAIPIIVAAIVAWSPLILERYHMDITFLLAILSFLIIPCYKKLSNKTVIIFCILTSVMCFWFYLVPYDNHIGTFLFK